MDNVRRIAFATIVAFTAAGCRSATRMVDVPRADLELSGAGNRGYLVGTPPAAPELKTERRMVETEVEVPPFGRAKGQAPAAGVGVTDVSAEESSGDVAASIPTTFDSYTVKKKDSLWSIAANPAVFGDGTKWRRLYAANRDRLKSPNRLRPGMTLRIPRDQAGGPTQAPAPSTEKTTWTK